MDDMRVMSMRIALARSRRVPRLTCGADASLAMLLVLVLSAEHRLPGGVCTDSA